MDEQEVKGCMKMYGIKNSYIALAAVAVVAFLIFVWPVGLLMPHEQATHEVPGVGLLTDSQYNDYLKNQPKTSAQTSGSEAKANLTAPAAPTAPVAPVLPVTVSEASQTADQTADDGADELVPESKPKTKGKTIKMSVFKGWVSDELTIQDSDISEFIVFADKTAVEDFVKGYSWNDKFDFQWNCDVLGIDIANDYGEADPAPATFGTTGTSGNIYFVALSSDGITPDYFQLDSNKDSKPEVIEKKSGNKNVLAVDDWSTDAL